MTADDFRRLALGLPEALESAHMGHPDFRVGGKVFASLGPKEDWGMVKLTPDEQRTFMRAGAESFHPASGAWGRRGCTIVRLGEAEESIVRQALTAAWRNAAPKKIHWQLEEE
jgi:hypothetical protein